MLNNTDAMWEDWGKSDPYYGVLTAEEFHSENLLQSKHAFFRSGRNHIADISRAVERGFGVADRHSALDFGCGVGRLLLPLSELFEHVDGLDVSPSMLKEALANIHEHGIDNVELLSSSDELTSISDKQYDFVHSHLVFQHIPTKRGYVLIDKLLSHIGPNGCFYIQVPIKRIASPVRRVAYFIKHRVPFAYVGFNMVDRKDPFTPTMQMNLYDFGTLVRIFGKHGFETVAYRSEIQRVRTGTVFMAGFFSRRVS
jgi:SAM-dependent methyltransferase